MRGLRLHSRRLGPGRGTPGDPLVQDWQRWHAVILNELPHRPAAVSSLSSSNNPRPIRNGWRQKGGVQSWPGRPDLLDGLKAPPPLKLQLQHHVLVGLLSPNSSHMVQVL